MKKPEMLPVGVTELTYEHYFRHFSRQSNIVYVTVLLAVTAAFVALFFVSADIVVRGTGTLSASGNRSWIKAPVSGKVAAVMIRENRPFKAGTPLFIMKSDLLDQEVSYLRKRKQEVNQKIRDLRQLVMLCRDRDVSKPRSLVTSVYRQQYELLRQEVSGATMRLRNHQADFRRHRQLFRAGVVAASEFEDHRFSVEHASNELVLLYRQQGIRWQQDLNRLKTTLSELDSKERRLGEEKEIYTIRAPAGGSLQLVEGLHPGAFLNQGEEVARFSPDSGLYAKIWISPARIGLIREGMRVRLHVDAFNYQQWGIITGNVVRISEDVTPAGDGAPFFEIMCSLDKRSLVLENGYKGELRKGMSVRARLLVAERTLFQLFYDSIDDWLNPYGQDKG